MTERTDGTYESTSDIRSPAELRAFYIDSIAAATSEEDKWFKKAAETWKVYTGEKGGAFNILHSNTETIVPAIFNSLPVADIRVRFNDRDEVARRGAQILERALSYEMDEYDAQEVAEKAIRDFAITGRGVLRVKYDPLFDNRPQLDHRGQPVNGPDGGPIEQEVLVWESVKCEFTPFDRFRRGPGTHWEQVSWVAFQKFYTKDELKRLVGSNEALTPQQVAEIVDNVQLDCSTNGSAEEKSNKAKREKDVFRCASVWEVWDKDRRHVAYVSDSYEAGPLAVIPDPLKLGGFFPCPRPMQVLNYPGTMVPIVPYSIYERQAKELDRISDRILKLTEQAKYNGIFGSEIAELSSLETLEDGQFLPSMDAMSVVNNKGALDNYIWSRPIDKIVAVIQILIQQREAIKATIFELMGIADIMRGASAATETLGAQKLKAQWGSLKIQIWQNEVQRFWRDLFRLKAEIIAEHFQPDTLMAISGEKPPQPPQPNPQAQPEQQRMQMQQFQQQMQAHEQMMSQVFELLKSDIQRRYMIDIETDSTIQADKARDRQELAEFMKMSSEYLQSSMLAVQAGFKPAILIAVFQSIAQKYKLGKQVDDELAKLSDEAIPMAEHQQQQQLEQKEQERETREIAKQAATLDIQQKQIDLQKGAYEVQGQAIENQQAADYGIRPGFVSG